MSKKISLKKFLFSLGTLVLGIGLGFLVWYVFMGGSQMLNDDSALPTESSGGYDGFYYKNLGNEEKIAYELVMAEIENMPERIEIPNIDEDIANFFEALVYDNPEYFFFSSNFNIETNNFGQCFFVPEYEMTPAEYKAQKEELERVRDLILAKADGITDHYELELIAHDYIINRCEYIEKTGGTYSSAYGCLVRGYASCEGYAKAMKYLLDEFKIENYLVSGTAVNEKGQPEGHAWNMVKIDGEYYHLDPTWNDPISKEDENHYSYFNITDKEISFTHNVDKRFLGKCVNEDANYYKMEKLLFSSYNAETRSALVAEIIQCAENNENVMSFKFANAEAMEDAKEALFDMQGVYSLLVSANLMTDKELAQEDVKYIADDEKLIITITDFLD